MTDFEIDEWVTANSALGHKRLHALGVIAYQWNRAELWLFHIFCDVSGFDEPEAWALIYDLGDVAICGRIKTLLKFRNLAAEAPLIENALEIYDICRQNRNSAMHAWTRGLSADGHIGLARKSKKADQIDPEPFPSSLDDLRRVAKDIEALNNRLWLLSCFAEDGQPPTSLDILPVPNALWTPPPQASTRQKRQPQS